MEIQELQNQISQNQAILIYFYNDNCAPCKVLRPKVQHLVETTFPLISFSLINSETFPVTASTFGVFASPVILLFIEGKEYLRESKNISISELNQKLDRIYKMALSD
jgi:thioredoxin-like negative regulator of GroEL